MTLLPHTIASMLGANTQKCNCIPLRIGKQGLRAYSCIEHAYFEPHRSFIYRGNALDLYFSAKIWQFAYLQCTFSQCPTQQGAEIPTSQPGQPQFTLSLQQCITPTFGVQLVSQQKTSLYAVMIQRPDWYHEPELAWLGCANLCSKLELQ